MTAISEHQTGEAFAAALHSDGPAADRADAMQLYGRFIGAWDGDLWFVDPEGNEYNVSAEVQFGWVLEGRAIQDVWIAPARKDPSPRPRMYGTTVRVYNPERGDWEITFIDPSRQRYNRQRGKAVGNEIVQEAREDDGSLTQWIFTDIEPDSFRWWSRSSADGGRTWHKLSEFRFRRRAG
jgi:hypothetical protein